MLTTRQRQTRAKDMARYHAMMATGDIEGAKKKGREAASAARKAGASKREVYAAYTRAHRRHLKATSDQQVVSEAIRSGWKSERGF